MNLLYGAYIVISSALFLVCFPPFWFYTRITGRYGKDLKERLGCVSRDITQSLKGSPRIWIHAVSLGEIIVAESIIKALRNIMPDSSIVLSTTTEHGRNLAKETFGDRVPVIYAPIDFIASVRKAIYAVRPDILVFLETEIWPVWIKEARRMGIKTALVNGRISVRSFNGYHRFRSFFRSILGGMDSFSMITEEDKIRIASIGADPHKITVNGNAKYDLLTNMADPSIEGEMRKILNLEVSCPVFIAGSTRNGEEAMIIEAYKKIKKEFPDMVLIIAPRHIDRTREIASILERQKLRYQLRTEIDNDTVKRTEQIVIINSFGELFKIYSIGTIIFCGASLVPLGGQNPMEAAVWGKAVFYGPHMEDFLDAKALLDENGSGIEVSSPEMIAERAIHLLRDPALLKNYGARARETVLKNRNAAERQARVISGLIC
ncbi:3-deoxy-D-manno-octulosonic acid transferase [Deltaproteobacteria bacterium]|nr:3-deoxy-D-manno-octulosonic acid transferase [Deltaproteobacteria bacterium]